MRFTMLGRKGRIRMSRLKKYHGKCEEPADRGTSDVILDTSLRGRRELETIIHELQHFASWHHEEAYVKDVSRAMADVLWRWGYRKQL